MPLFFLIPFLAIPLVAEAASGLDEVKKDVSRTVATAAVALVAFFFLARTIK